MQQKNPHTEVHEFLAFTFIIDAKTILLITHINDFIVKYLAAARCEIICLTQIVK